jgi:hypothetical protein
LVQDLESKVEFGCLATRRARHYRPVGPVARREAPSKARSNRLRFHVSSLVTRFGSQHLRQRPCDPLQAFPGAQRECTEQGQRREAGSGGGSCRGALDKSVQGRMKTVWISPRQNQRLVFAASQARERPGSLYPHVRHAPGQQIALQGSTKKMFREVLRKRHA